MSIEVEKIYQLKIEIPSLDIIKDVEGNREKLCQIRKEFSTIAQQLDDVVGKMNFMKKPTPIYRMGRIGIRNKITKFISSQIKPFNIQDLKKATGISISTLYRHLGDEVASGTIRSYKVGQTRMYQVINPKKPINREDGNGIEVFEGKDIRVMPDRNRD